MCVEERDLRSNARNFPELKGVSKLKGPWCVYTMNEKMHIEAIMVYFKMSKLGDKASRNNNKYRVIHKVEWIIQK